MLLAVDEKLQSISFTEALDQALAVLIGATW
jgi:hypothetical protein